ncbi:MAG: 1,4-alpha-glucan branching enzyme, partial [Methylobacterium sp.]|nr:1,4-alpha-glucan branching enzyme [Methylobacterium sp.]
ANLRLYLAMMWTHPGKKLLFMGCEFGAQDEWSVDAPFPWPHPFDERRQGASKLVRDLNALYRATPALHRLDHQPEGFAWIVADDSANAVFAFSRASRPGAAEILVVANMTPVPRHDYRIGVPHAGLWRERLNSDAQSYGGSNLGNGGAVETHGVAAHGHPQSLSLLLPPLGLLVLEHDAHGVEGA